MIFFSASERIFEGADEKGEMMHAQLLDSAHQAQVVLGAWASGNVERFCQEIGRINLSIDESEDPAEAERMDLLAAIAADLSVPSLQPAADDPNNVYSSLLRHLAFSRPASTLLQ